MKVDTDIPTLMVSWAYLTINYPIHCQAKKQHLYSDLLGQFGSRGTNMTNKKKREYKLNILYQQVPSH